MTRIKNVKNTTKFERSIKAISPVIATLLMIAIAVVASLVVYAWVTGYMGNTTSKAGKAIQIQSFASQGGNLVIYVQNVGQGDVELNRDQSVYVNSNLIPLRSTMQAKIPIIAGQTVELLTDFAYTAGTKVNIKVTTTDGTFMTITGTGTSTNNPSPTTPPVTYPVDFGLGTGGLSMNPPDGPHNVGGATAITATANTGYHFTSWTSTGSITFADANAASTTATVNGAGSITANFAADTVQYSVTFALGSNGATITPTAGAQTYNSGDVVTISATANSGYHFTSWTSTTTSITFANANSASTTATIDAAGTVTANFAADTVQYSVTFALGSNGATITPTAGAQTYNSGDVVTISATANSGYHFTSWTSTTTSITFANANSASTTATIDAAGTVTANFAANTPLTITLRPNGAGSTTQLNAQGTGSANWDRVDEATGDSAITYVRGTSNDGWQVDTYNIPDQTLSGTITNVRIYIVALESTDRPDDTYGRTAIAIGSGSIQYGTQLDLTTTWAQSSTPYATKTGNLGSGAWTWTDINNLQIGVSLQSHQSSFNNWRYAECTQVWVEITYIPA